MLSEVERLASHDSFRTYRVRDSSLGRKVIQQLYGSEHYVDDQKFGDVIEG